MRIETLLTLLQFSDGLFPAGGYAHSFGLETFIEDGRVSDREAVAKLLHAHLEGSAGPCDAVAAVSAWRAARLGDLDACFQLDFKLDAVKAAAEMREASTQLGHQTLRIAAVLIDNAVVGAYARAANSHSTPAHHGVVFGVIGAACEWPPDACAAALLYSTTVAIVGAATRLIPLGQTEAQRLIKEALPLVTKLAGNAARMTPADMFTFAPALEIAAMHHAQLEARLFKS
jgi:urease accessory protein